MPPSSDPTPSSPGPLPAPPADECPQPPDGVGVRETGQASPSSLPTFGPTAATLLDRWRLILGRESLALTDTHARAARTLDDLYGSGHGEGSARLGSGPGHGRETARPAIREWADELDALFGPHVREEVLARAVERGELDAAFELDPDGVTASVDLLTQVLTLAGSLPEARLGRLRRLADRLVADLTRALATRLRPALTGLTTPRPTRRPSGPLDLARTVRANLRTARRTPDGHVLVPERLVFRTRAKRGADWDVHILVDVSGSMERSTVYSALVASVLNGVPALSVRLAAFSTSVTDFTEHVADPLRILLEVSIGGGTDIGAGLRYVRDRVRVPARTIVAVVTDFDEGASVPRLLGEVRALVTGGVHVLGLAALDDAGRPVYHRAVAERVAEAGAQVAALSPVELASWIGEKVRGR